MWGLPRTYAREASSAQEGQTKCLGVSFHDIVLCSLGEKAAFSAKFPYTGPLLSNRGSRTRWGEMKPGVDE